MMKLVYRVMTLGFVPNRCAASQMPAEGKPRIPAVSSLGSRLYPEVTQAQERLVFFFSFGFVLIQQSTRELRNAA